MRIVTHDLTKSFRSVTALDRISLDVGPGMVGLLGSNGAGKTTLMRILAGVLRPTSGSVLVGSFDVTRPDQRRDLQRRLGYLPQDLGLYPDLTAQEFLEYVGLLKGLSRADRREQADRALHEVSLSDVAGRRLRGFSGGMRRRVGIAQALLGAPQLLIVDEPTAGLDPEERLRFRSLLARLECDRTVLLSTHLLDDVAQTCPNLVVLDRSRLLFQGRTDALLDLVRDRVYLVPSALGPEVTRSAGVTVVGEVTSPTGPALRVVAEDRPADGHPVDATLDDAYTALLSDARTTREHVR